MYIPPGQKSGFSASPYANKMTFYTLLCFALAGLLIGFALGGFAGHLTRNSLANASSPTSSAPILAGHGPHPPTTPTQENVLLGIPAVAPGDYTSPETADGTTHYQFSTLIVSKTANTPITTNDITCRLWFTNDAQATTSGLSANSYALPRNLSSFSQPFPGEVTGALAFSAPTSQTQPCAAYQKTTWTYTLAAGIPHGTYYLTVLADWKGIHFNWHIIAINVDNGENHGNV